MSQRRSGRPHRGRGQSSTGPDGTRHTNSFRRRISPPFSEGQTTRSGPGRRRENPWGRGSPDSRFSGNDTTLAARAPARRSQGKGPPACAPGTPASGYPARPSPAPSAPPWRGRWRRYGWPGASGPSPPQGVRRPATAVRPVCSPARGRGRARERSPPRRRPPAIPKRSAGAWGGSRSGWEPVLPESPSRAGRSRCRR